MRVDDGCFLSLVEVASRYGVAYCTAHKWAQCGRLPAFQVGGKGRWYVRGAELRHMEDANPRTHREPQDGPA